ncbi:hypothetical protein [Bacillus sp. CGMCC 1.16541]|uniref:hypothetical protein n=1 Tax=Bacillus sp. CGMCC 1.16541 TaxID=2185143 RepID=UPI0013A583CC|nr:hypothetical protein [Bacillus sp. CGMCC 1.16541]
MVGSRSTTNVSEHYGCTAIGCTFGFGTKEELADADALIDNMKELERHIEQMTQKS